MKIQEKAKLLKKLIKQHKTIFIVGHKNLDLDALGSALGIYHITQKYNKKSYIIIDDETHELGVEKIINEQKANFFISSSQIDELKDNNSLLIIVDTNKSNLLQNEELLNKFDEIIIIDHHQTGEKTIKKGLQIIDETTSSTCQMISELIRVFNIKISKEVATVILSGIVLDTNNFVLKTNSDTYYAAYFLTTLGADPKKVQYYLKQDINDYIIRQTPITNVQVIKGKYAITMGVDKLIYRREELAKIADTLLQFNGIEASFVLGKTSSNIIGLSARSEGTIDVGEIAETLGGGGDKYEAAAQLENTDLNQIKEDIIKILN